MRCPPFDKSKPKIVSPGFKHAKKTAALAMHLNEAEHYTIRLQIFVLIALLQCPLPDQQFHSHRSIVYPEDLPHIYWLNKNLASITCLEVKFSDAINSIPYSCLSASLGQLDQRFGVSFHSFIMIMCLIKIIVSQK